MGFDVDTEKIVVAVAEPEIARGLGAAHEKGIVHHAVDLGGRRRVLFEAPAAMDVHDVSPQGTALVTQLQSRTAASR